MYKLPFIDQYITFILLKNFHLQIALLKTKYYKKTTYDSEPNMNNKITRNSLINEYLPITQLLTTHDAKSSKKLIPRLKNLLIVLIKIKIYYNNYVEVVFFFFIQIFLRKLIHCQMYDP